MRIMYIGHRRGNIMVRDIEYHLYELQHLVGGFIETVHIPELREKGILLIANEEGLLMQLPVNQNLLPFLFVGNLLAVGDGGEDFTSLTHSQIEFLKDWVYRLNTTE